MLTYGILTNAETIASNTSTTESQNVHADGVCMSMSALPGYDSPKKATKKTSKHRGAILLYTSKSANPANQQTRTITARYETYQTVAPCSRNHPDGLSKECSEPMDDIGLPHVLHTLRHTHASQLTLSGMDILTVSRRLGHRSPAITLTVYGHLLSPMDDTAAIMQATFANAGVEG